MTVGEAKAKYEGIKRTYKNTVENLNATSYETSMLFQEVDAFNKNIHTNIIDKLDEFADNLRAIKIDESNYKNTVSKIGSLKSSVAEGRIAIDGYNTSISKKAIEVFNEYTEKFGAFGRLYENNKNSAEKLIRLAEEADSKYNNPPEYTKTNTLGEVVTDYSAIGSYRNDWANKRNNYLKQSESQLEFMEKNRASMQELLDKGLKKVA